MALSHASFCLSSDTLKISKPFAFLNFFLLYFSYACTTLGFSRLHGPHHDAQKSINTTFPLSEDNLTIVLSGLGSTISGARSPTFSPTGMSFFSFWFELIKPVAATAAIITDKIKIDFFILVLSFVTSIKTSAKYTE